MTLNSMRSAPKDGKFILAFYGGDNWHYPQDPINVKWVVVHYSRSLVDSTNYYWHEWGPRSFREMDLAGWVELPKFDKYGLLDEEI